MKQTYVKDLVDGSRVDESFMVKAVEMKTAKNGKDYLNLTLCDKTGSINAKRWDADQSVLDLFKPGTVVKISGRIGSYQGVAQVVVDRAATVTVDDMGEYIESTPFDIDEMWEGLKKCINSIEDPDISKLLSELFLNDQVFADQFKIAPAAMALHHAYRGGLLEHTLSLARQAHHIGKHHPSLNRDLLVTAALIHDIGKITELEYETEIKYSELGNLVGHLVIGVLWLDHAIERLNDDKYTFPLRKRALLYHLILSHHLKGEWGSPVAPKTPEAYVFHCLDQVDAKTFIADKAISSDKSDEPFTGKVWAFDDLRLFKAKLEDL